MHTDAMPSQTPPANTAPPPATPEPAAAHPAEDTMTPQRKAELDELRAFIGPRADYYQRHWVLVLDNPDRPKTNNWGAFLFSGGWLAYRKMYRLSLILFTLLLLQLILEEILFLGILGRAETPAVLSHIITLIVAAICGYFGNHWYLRHAQQVIQRTKEEGFRGEELLEELKRRGGVNLMAALGLMLAYMTAAFVAVLVTAFLFDPEFRALFGGMLGGAG